MRVNPGGVVCYARAVNPVHDYICIYTPSASPSTASSPAVDGAGTAIYINVYVYMICI